MPSGKPSKFNMALRYAKRAWARRCLPTGLGNKQGISLTKGTGADLDAWQLDKITDQAIRARDKLITSTMSDPAIIAARLLRKERDLEAEIDWLRGALEWVIMHISASRSTIEEHCRMTLKSDSY